MMGAPPGPIIVLCPPRSFSTVVSHMLGQHPQICTMAENGLFFADDMNQWRERYLERPQFSDGAKRTVARLLFSGESPESLAMAADLLRSRSGSTDDLLVELQTAANPRLLLDKSPMELTLGETLDRLRERWPTARFLHLTRHPYTSIASLILWPSSRSWASNSMAALAPLMWWSAHRTASEFLFRLPADRAVTLRAEDILKDPVGTLTPVLAQWELRTDAEALEVLAHPERGARVADPERAGGDSRFYADPVLVVPDEPPRLVMPPNAVTSPKLTRVIAEMARGFGYDVGPV